MPLAHGAPSGVPLLNRHIRALSHRVVNGAPLTTNMLSWAKQHVEWSLAAGEYDDPNGVLMLVIDVNGDALMSVGPYEPLADCSRAALVSRAAAARAEEVVAAVAPELLGAVTADGRVLLAAREGEPLCGAATLVEQLASTRGCAVERALAGADSVEEFVADLGTTPWCSWFPTSTAWSWRPVPPGAPPSWPSSCLRASPSFSP